MTQSRHIQHKAPKGHSRADPFNRTERRERIARRKGKGPKRPSWFQGKRPVLRFVLLFGICMGVFYAVAATPTAISGVLPAYLKLNAEVSGSLLRLLGQDVTVHGKSIHSARASLSIERGCDAIHPSALFVSAVLAFPASVWRKIGGAGGGVVVLLTINLVRIISLFYVRLHYPAAFEIMHVEVWQALFIFLALLCWIVWVRWALRAGEEQSCVSV